MSLRAFLGFAGSCLFGGSCASYISNNNNQQNQHSSVVHCAPALPDTTTCPFSPTDYRGFRLISSRYESPDTRRFYFALGNNSQNLNLPVSSCIVAMYKDTDGKEIVRPYTPTSDNSTPGRFELMIKRYPKSKMGTHVFSLRPGEELLFKGPYVKFPYKANQWTHIGMLAGGTGITPMFQVIQHVLANPKDTTQLSLVYGNNSRKDILLANELCELQKTYKNFNMYVTLLDVPKRWLGGVGYINEAVVKAFLPKPQEKNTKILVCGPSPMMKALSGDKDYTSTPPKQGELSGLLKNMGYSADQVFKF